MSTLDFKRHRKIAGPLAALALLAGCATATPYQPLGYPGERGGFTDQQLDASHYRVSFYGNSLTSRQQVENYLLYRAAELTLSRGFNCFTTVAHATDKDTTVQVNPYGPYGGGFYPYWSPYWRLHGGFGWYSYDPFFGGPFFPRSYDVDTIDRYQATADIAVSNSCAASPATFNAQQVMQNLRPYIVYPKPR
ncbi:MAG TPA: hypothetical protein VFI88_02465 [Sphingomicrobium sp.]|jgi:hypothetical protein|nr:hypothetical protein [Sphingomicrobium sp.]